MSNPLPRYTLPLLWFSLAFLAGILLASTLALPWTAWLALAGLPPLAAWIIRRHPLAAALGGLFRPLPRLGAAPFILWIALFGGALRAQLAQPNLADGHIAAFNERGLTRITGVVAAPPEQRDSATLLRLRVERVALLDGDVFSAPVPVRGLLLARLPAGLETHYGDRLALTGQPQTPPELAEFSYRAYLAREGVYTYLPYARVSWLASNQGNPLLSAVFALRERLLQSVARLFPPDEAALLSGILLGDEGRIPARLEQAFTRTGTAHIIAISGFNIAILSALFSNLFTRLLGPRRGAAAALLAIAFYTLLVGAGASVVRAAIMGGVALFARQLGRRQAGLNTLAFTAFVMCLVQPNALWDAGFQLSFFATLGLVLYAGPLQNGFTRLASRVLPAAWVRRLAQPVGEYLLFTLAAQVTTLPVVALHFGRVSLVSLLANPLILPPQPLVMVLGGLAALLGAVALPLGQLAAWAAWPFVAYTIRAVEWLDRLPHGSFETGPLSLGWAVLFYAVLLGVTFMWPRREQLWPKLLRIVLRPGAAMLVLAAAACLIWQSALTRPDGRLRLTLLPGAQGQAVLVQTPTGRALLVGGQPGASGLLSGLSRRLPLVDPRLDALLVLGSRAEDLGGLPALVDRYPPGFALWAGSPGTTQAARLLTARLERRAIPLVAAEPGHRLDLGEGIALHVLDAGPGGASLLLEWGGFRALWLAGGADYPAGLGQVAVLFAEAPLDAPQPPWLIVARDASGVAATQTLSPSGDGWVQIITDGESLWLRGDRP